MILPTADTTLIMLGRLLHGMTSRYQSAEVDEIPGALDRVTPRAVATAL